MRATTLSRRLCVGLAFAALAWPLEAQTPTISLPESIDFDLVPVARQETREVELLWPGPGTIAFRVETGGPFEVTPNQGTLVPNQSVILRISVRPAAPGVLDGFARIQVMSPNAALIPPKQIALRATATQSKAPDGRPPEKSPPRWNSWVQKHPAGAPVESLVVGQNYNVQFDLAALDYEKFFGGVASAGPDIDFARELSQIPDDTIEVLAVPVLLGRGLQFLPDQETARVYTIDLRKLRAPQDAAAAGESLPAFSQRVRAMQATVGVEATEPGCAAIALTLWSRSRNQPYDHIVRELSVGGEAACGTGASVPLKAGLLSLLALPFEKPAAAALHVFETKVGGGDPSAAAVFIRKDAQPLSWRPAKLISAFVGADGAAGLRYQIGIARCVGSDGQKNCTHDYSTVARQLRDALFNDKTQAGQARADQALAELEELTRSAKPDVFVRLVDTQGRNIFLPLGLLGLGEGQTLGQKTTLMTPLPKQEAHPDGCVGAWKFVLPEKLKGVADIYLKPIEGSIPDADRIAKWVDFLPYAQPEKQPTRREGFLLLTHHTAGLVTFEPGSKDSLQSDQFKRRFPAGSVAILAGCSVGQLVGDNKGLPLLTTLNDQGISAAIVSPFDIKGPLGARFAVHFADIVERARRSKEAAELRTLYQRALDETRSDPLVSAFAAELDELLLIGDSQIPLCKEGP